MNRRSLHQSLLSPSRRSALLLAAGGLVAGGIQASARAAPAVAPKKVLLVVRVEGKSLPIDQKIAQYLTARGHAVTIHSQYAPVDAAHDADLVILSSTIRSQYLFTGYADAMPHAVAGAGVVVDSIRSKPARRTRTRRQPVGTGAGACGNRLGAAVPSIQA